MPPLPPWAAPVLLVIVAITWMMFWVGTLRLIARLGGWRKLAEHYRAERPAEGARWRWCSLTLGRWCGYNGAVTVTANERGLGLSLPWFFAFGHDEVFIPWRDVTPVVRQQTFTRAVTLTTSLAPSVPITISMKLAKRVAQTVPHSPLPLQSLA
jgi:hypothetical protein